MTRLEQIEQDVAGLSPDELARFRDWFDAYAAERFDAAIADAVPTRTRPTKNVASAGPARPAGRGGKFRTS